MFLRFRNSWRLHRHFRKVKRDQKRDNIVQLAEYRYIPFFPPDKEAS